jgi:hypothetical protein
MLFNSLWRTGLGVAPPNTLDHDRLDFGCLSIESMEGVVSTWVKVYGDSVDISFFPPLHENGLRVRYRICCFSTSWDGHSVNLHPCSVPQSVSIFSARNVEAVHGLLRQIDKR